eukprot:185573-Lingulodinium_polyedra.AAC.1
MGKLNESCVLDVCAANDCVNFLKKDPELGLITPRIVPDRLRWATAHDASWANASDDKSQGGHI